LQLLPTKSLTLSLGSWTIRPKHLPIRQGHLHSLKSFFPQLSYFFPDYTRPGTDSFYSAQNFVFLAPHTRYFARTIISYLFPIYTFSVQQSQQQQQQQQQQKKTMRK
jgi:hypothetical protein